MQTIAILYALFAVLAFSQYSHCVPALLAKLSRRKSGDLKTLGEQRNRQSAEETTAIFKYRSLKDKREKNVYAIAGGSKTGGTNGELFFGQMDNREKCVAIKLFNYGEKKKIFENAVLVMNTIQKSLLQQERRHIIELIDCGISIGNSLNAKVGSGEGAAEVGKNIGDESEYGVLVMERGVESFCERIYKDRTDYSPNDNRLTNLLIQIVLPLRDLHREVGQAGAETGAPVRPGAFWSTGAGNRRRPKSRPSFHLMYIDWCAGIGACRKRSRGDWLIRWHAPRL